MSEYRSLDSELLAPVEMLVRDFVRANSANPVEARFQLLEAIASRLGGFSLDEFNAHFKINAVSNAGKLLDSTNRVLKALECSAVPLPLALSALAREDIDKSARRSNGAYHTDFRLAQRLAEIIAPEPTLRTRVIDPACGAGILLVAVSMRVCGHDHRKMARWLSECVYASDLSLNSLRGAVLSLASLTSDVQAIIKMRAKWRVGDSLLAPVSDWRSLSPKGFDLVIANPPWEKVKLTRHEFLKSNGDKRHYGAQTVGLDRGAFSRRQASVARYAEQLGRQYPLLAKGEPDLYVAFTELFEKLCRPGGIIAAILPGGLIRSQGTEALRCHLFHISSNVSISIIENRARFFAIDSRFKFLIITCVKPYNVSAKYKPIV